MIVCNPVNGNGGGDRHSQDDERMDDAEDNVLLKTPPNFILPSCLLKPPPLRWQNMKKRCAQEKEITFPIMNFWEMLNALTDDEEENERGEPVESSVDVQKDDGNHIEVATESRAKRNGQFNEKNEN